MKIYGIKNLTQPKNQGNIENKNTLMTRISRSNLKSDMFVKTNNLSFGTEENEIKAGLSLKEIKLLDVKSPEFTELAAGDKLAATYLTKAAYILDEVYQKQDDPANIQFREVMKSKASKGDKQAKLIMKLYNAQKGITALDSNAQSVVLMKGHTKPEGQGFWPNDMTKEEIKNTLTKMLDENKTDEVRTILNQHSVVKKDGNYLKAVDYSEEYKKEYTEAADNIKKASQYSTNSDFNEYLKLQANALRTSDEKADALAEMKWASLQDTPLEFTITKEGYTDTISKYLLSDKDFSEKLNSKGITGYIKDNIGVRVGIVNKQGTSEIYDMKKYLNIIKNNMPFNNEYPKTATEKNIKQAMVDVDLIALTGDTGAYRAGITLAENLPNDDKLSLRLGGGRRNVYHRQVRFPSNAIKDKELSQKLLSKDIQKYYNILSDDWFTEIHENTHSFGPGTGNSKLGFATDILEEGKADMGIEVTDKLVEAGKYTKEQANEMYVTFITNLVKQNKKLPKIEQAHRVRAVLQLKNYLDTGAVTVEKVGTGKNASGFMHIDLEKVRTSSRQLLEKFVRFQINNNAEEAQKYIKENFVWTKDMELLAKTWRKCSKALNGALKSPLAEHLLKQIH